MKKKTKILLGVSITLIVAVICYVIAGVVIYNYNATHSIYSSDVITGINKYINMLNGISDEAVNEKIEKEISQKDMVEYLENMKNQGKIKDYFCENGDVMVEFPSGGKMYNNHYRPGYQSGGSTNNNKSRNEINQNISSDNNTLSVLTAQPYANDSEMTSDIFDNSATLIENSDLGYQFTDNIDDENVTIDFMKSLSKYKVIIFDGHGVYNPENNSFVGIALGEYMTTENYNKYIDEINSGILSLTSDGRYVVTPVFFEHYYKDNSFNDTLIYFGCCDVANDDSNLSEILIKKGAEAVLAYKNSVNVTYNRSMCETIFNELVKKDGDTNSTKTVAEALETAKKQNGEKDPTHTEWYDFILYPIFQDYVKKSDRAELILTENDDNSFRLVDEKKTDNSTNYKNLYNEYVNKNIIPEIGICKNFEQTFSNVPEQEIYKYVKNNKGLASVYIEDFNNDNIPEMITVSALGKDNGFIKIQVNLYCIENNKVIDKGIVYETEKYDNADEQLYVYTVNNSDNKYLCLSDQFWYGGSSSGSIYAQYFKAISIDNKNSSSEKADITFSYNRGNVTYKINGNEYIVAKDGVSTDNSSLVESKLSETFTTIGLNEFKGVNIETSNWMNFPQKATALKIFECGTKYASDYEYKAYLKDYTDFSNKHNEVNITIKETTTKLEETTSAKKETTTKEKTTESNLKNELLNYYWIGNSEQLAYPNKNIYEFTSGNEVYRYEGDVSKPKSSWTKYNKKITYTLDGNALCINFVDDGFIIKLNYVKANEYVNRNLTGYCFYQTDFVSDGSPAEAMYLFKNKLK